MDLEYYKICVYYNIMLLSYAFMYIYKLRNLYLCLVVTKKQKQNIYFFVLCLHF